MFPMPGDPQQPGTPYPVPGAPYSPGFPGVPEGPLDGLQASVANVLNSADSHHVYMPGTDGEVLQYPRGRQPSVVRDMAIGAAVGFGSWLVWRRMQRRYQATGEYTSPGFRCLALLLLPLAIGFGLSMIWVAETGKLTGGGLTLGVILATVYAVYRARGHGRYNTRRAGSPWRGERRP